MHLLYRSTSFCIPVGKKLLGCAMLMADRTTFISNTCSTRFKPFHPLVNFSLTHGALSILSQHTTVNLRRFHYFCPKKPHYATLFFDGAILQRSVHVFTLVFRFVCNAKFTYLTQYLVSLSDAKSTCSAYYLAPVNEFCCSLTVWNEQVRNVKILK